MFDLSHQGIVKWPVTLTQQRGDGGFEDVVIQVSFQKLKRSELKARDAQSRKRLTGQLLGVLRNQQAGAAPPADLEKTLEQIDADVQKADRDQEASLLDAIKDWDGPVSDGQPVACSRPVLLSLFEDEPTFQAFALALEDCSRNAKPKNSLPGPAGT